MVANVMLGLVEGYYFMVDPTILPANQFTAASRNNHAFGISAAAARAFSKVFLPYEWSQSSPYNQYTDVAILVVCSDIAYGA